MYILHVFMLALILTCAHSRVLLGSTEHRRSLYHSLRDVIVEGDVDLSTGFKYAHCTHRVNGRLVKATFYAGRFYPHYQLTEGNPGDVSSEGAYRACLDEYKSLKVDVLYDVGLTALALASFAKQLGMTRDLNAVPALEFVINIAKRNLDRSDKRKLAHSHPPPRENNNKFGIENSNNAYFRQPLETIYKEPKNFLSYAEGGYAGNSFSSGVLPHSSSAEGSLHSHSFSSEMLPFSQGSSGAGWLPQQGSSGAGWVPQQGSSGAGWVPQQGSSGAGWVPQQGSSGAGWVPQQGSSGAGWVPQQGSSAEVDHYQLGSVQARNRFSIGGSAVSNRDLHAGLPESDLHFDHHDEGLKNLHSSISEADRRDLLGGRSDSGLADVKDAYKDSGLKELQPGFADRRQNLS